MAPVPVLSFLLLVLICFASYVSCEGPTLNGTTIDWKDNFDDKGDEGSGLSTEYDAKGLQPWYNFVNGFISIVLSKEPYDLLFKVKDGTWDIKNDLALGYGLGLAICVGIGVLFIVIMPIVGLCFCCCRCCGRCGGDMSQKETENNNCKRSVFGVILLMITLLMFSGVLLTFVCNDRMSDTVEEMSKTSKGILDEAILFINRTVGEVEKVLLVDFPFVTSQLSNDISDENLGVLVGDPLLNEIDTVSVKPVEAVQNLAKETKRMRDQLEAISDNSKSLSQATVELNSGLDESRKNLTEIQNECNTSIGQPFCNDINPSSLASEANFTNLPNVSQELSSVQDVVNQDFEKTAQEGLDEVKNIPSKIINDTRETRAEIRRQISDASQTVSNLTTDLRKIADNDVISLLKNLRDQEIPKIVTFVKPIDRYRWIAGVGLTCMLLLIVVLMALGLMCGVCGYDKEATPTTRGTVSNMGGLSLMAAVGFCFIFASFLMILTTLCFLIGTPLQEVCSLLENDALYTQVIDKPQFLGSDGYFLSTTFFGKDKGDIEFTISGFLQSCRENKPLYVAGPFDEAFNISKKLDIKELLGNDSTQTFEDLKVNLSDVNVISNETKNSLIDLSNSGVDDIDFDAFLNETNKGITAVNLTEIADDVDQLAKEFQNFANNTNNASIKAKAYELGNKSLDTAQGLRDLDTNVVQVMAKQSNDLGQNVQGLRSIGSNLKIVANDTLKEAEKAEEFLHTNSSKNINDIVTKFIDRVLGWGFQFTDHIQDLLNDDLGKCKPVAKIHDAVITFVCKKSLFPFNGFWFSIGFCLFFFIPAIIFSVKLAKHYRCMDYESEFDEGMDAEMYEMDQPHHYSGAPPPYGSEKKSWANPNGHPNYH
ncbi:prominin-1-A-like isoform X2 [Montipora capricornis]|uniref:prominin-1-A-like isoform X2 n=1 Tax=Montipora capricornis TaxID=246305 RepID=UPI0035F1FCDC